MGDSYTEDEVLHESVKISNVALYFSYSNIFYPDFVTVFFSQS